MPSEDANSQLAKQQNIWKVKPNRCGNISLLSAIAVGGDLGSRVVLSLYVEKQIALEL